MSEQKPKLSAEEILRTKFIPNVCSKEYFEHCLERKGEWLSSVSQALEAMQQYSNEQSAELQKENDFLKNECINLERAADKYKNDRYDAITEAAELQQRIKELEAVLKKIKRCDTLTAFYDDIIIDALNKSKS